MIVKSHVKMELTKDGLNQRIEAVQGDENTRMLVASRYINGIAWTVPDGVSVRVRYQNPDNTGGMYDSLEDGTPAWSAEGNRISVMLIPQMLAVPGEVNLQLQLHRGGAVLNTFSVCMEVRKNPAAHVLPPENYMNLTQWLQQELEHLQLPGGGTAAGLMSLTVGQVETLPPGREAYADIIQDGSEAVLNLGIPTGYQSFTVGKVETLAPGRDAYATIVQSGSDVVVNLGIPAGYSPSKGVDYWTEAEQAQMNTAIREEIAAGLEEVALELAQIGPEFAQELSQCTDESKLYVLPDGYLYAYTTKTTYTEPDELYDPAAAGLNLRHSGTPGTVVTGNGYVMTDYIPVNMTDADQTKLQITCEGFNAASNANPKFQKIGYYDSQKNCIGSRYILSTAAAGNGVKLEYSGNDTTVYIGYTNQNAKETFYDQIAYVRIEVNGTNSPSVEGDRNLIRSIIFPDAGGTSVMTGWQSTGHAFVPADYEERIVDLEARIQSHGQKLDALQMPEDTAIPGYWNEHLEEKAAAIHELQAAGGKDCFSFVMLADIHEDANLGKCSGALAGKLMDDCDIKYALILGDTVTRSSVTTESAMLESFGRAEKILAPIRHRALQTRGNHDGCWGDDGSSYYLHDLPTEKLHSLIWRKVGMIPGITADDTGSAYYVDDPANRVRYIMLNSHCLPGEEAGGAGYSTFRNARFGQMQLDWLIRDALNTANGWAIVVGTHVPLNDDYVSYFGGSSGESVLLRNLLAAYNAREEFRGSFEGTMGVDAVQIHADFSNAGGEVIAAVAGHSHMDTAGHWGVTVITTRCDAAEENTQELKAERRQGTITEQAFDILTVNRKTRTITATRIGAGENRTISY